MTDSKLENLLRYGNQGLALAQTASVGPWTPQTTEEIAKYRAECEAREVEARRTNIAYAIIGIAEQLVVNHNIGTAIAFEQATDLANAAKNFLETYKMTER